MPRKITYSTTKKTKLPNASTLGYGKWKAEAGDVIVYKEFYADGTYCTRFARVIGEILGTDDQGPDGRGLLLVLALADLLTFGYERWVDPKDVIECESPERGTAFLMWLFNEADPEEMFKYISDNLEVRQRAHPAFRGIDEDDWRVR